jgi:cholesterol transport system auxiliary component
MRNSNLKHVFGLMTAVVSLAGCVGGKIHYPSYYVLNLPAPVSTTSPAVPILGSVAVREFEAPRFLRAGPIVYRASAEELGFYEYHRWAIDPRRTVTSAMIRQMQSRGIFRSVDFYEGGQSSEYLLTGTLDHLEEVDQGSHVSVEAGLSARLIDTRTGVVLWQGALSKTVPLDQRSVPGVVTEMSGTVQSIVAGLVSSMQDRVSAASSSSIRAGSEQ